MDPMSRRSILLTSAAVIAGAAPQARALGADQMSQPIKPTKGATDNGLHDPARETENPDILVRLRPTRAWFRTCVFPISRLTKPRSII